MNEIVPILSLVVAALAVFIGPIIAFVIAKQQISSSLATSHKQIIAPMQQAWINSLRDVLAELTSKALHYYVAGFEERNDSEYQHLTLLEHRIQLMLNPAEQDHKELEKLIATMTSSLSIGADADEDFLASYSEVMTVSRRILKREWNVVKERIEKIQNIGG